MKKLLLLSAVAGLLFTSCSNDDSSMGTPTVNPKNIPVSIKLTSDNEFSTLRSVSPAEAGIKSITYLVYKESDGSYVKYKSLVSGDLSVINDTLPEGKYKIAILGSTIENLNNYSFLDTEDFPHVDESFYKASYIIRSASGNDHFYKDFTIDVASGKNAQSVVLNRITSKVQIIPSDVASIPTDVSDIAFYFDLLAAQTFTFSSNDFFNIYRYKADEFPSNYVYSRHLTRDQLLKVDINNPITLVLFPFASSDAINQEVPIKVFYMQNGEMQIKTIKTKYTLERNKVLRLTGNLFATSPSIVGGSISVDNDWDSEVVEDSFD